MSSYEIITNNISKIIDEEYLKTRLVDNQITIYWGISMSEIPTVRYLHTFMKISDFLRSGCKVIVLLADLHAYLQNKKKNWELIELRTKYYQEIILRVLKLLNVDISNLFFVKGSKFQLSIDYTIKYYDLLHRIKIDDAIKSMEGIIENDDTVSQLVYPILQLTDEYYLNVDVEFGDYKQEKIFELGHNVNKEKVNKTTYLIGPYINDFSINLLENESVIRQKIKKINFSKDDIENDLFKFMKYIILPKNNKISFKTFYDDKTYDLTTFEELQTLFLEKKVRPIDIKQIVCNFLIDFLKPLRDDKELYILLMKSYPKIK